MPRVLEASAHHLHAFLPNSTNLLVGTQSQTSVFADHVLQLLPCAASTPCRSAPLSCACALDKSKDPICAAQHGLKLRLREHFSDQRHSSDSQLQSNRRIGNQSNSCHQTACTPYLNAHVGNARSHLMLQQAMIAKVLTCVRCNAAATGSDWLRYSAELLLALQL